MYHTSKPCQFFWKIYIAWVECATQAWDFKEYKEMKSMPMIYDMIDDSQIVKLYTLCISMTLCT